MKSEAGPRSELLRAAMRRPYLISCPYGTGALVLLWFVMLSGQCLANSQELIENGTFQGTTSEWVTTGDFYANSTYTHPNAEPGYAYLANADGSSGNNLFGSVYQTITIPPDATSVTLSYWYNVGTFDVSGIAHDWLNVEVQNASGTVLEFAAMYSNLAATGTYAYQQGTYDLSSYKGQTIRICFLAWTGITDPTVFRIDDVSVIATTPTPNQRPSVSSITTPTSPQSGNVTISYSLTDAESDTCGIAVEYNPNGGSTWYGATAGSGGDGTIPLTSSPSGTAHAFVWASGSDIVNANSTNVRFRITPVDAGGPGTAGTTGTFTVNNYGNQRPSVPPITTPSGVPSGNVTISYSLTDAESDTCGIAVEYSPNGGSAWYGATAGSGGDGTIPLTSSPGGTAHTFVWASGSDIVNANNTNVRFRITPVDAGGPGTAGTTGTFTVNNDVNQQVTATIYVRYGSDNGAVLPGVQVTGQDGAGVNFDQTTNPNGYVTLLGAPGTWQFTIQKTGYVTTSWNQTISADGTWQAYFAVNTSSIIPATAPPNTLSNALKPIVNPDITTPSGQLMRWNGQAWDTVNSWTNNGIDPNQQTVVLVHGWKTAEGDRNFFDAGTAMAKLAHALSLQSASANILAWDWQDQSVSKVGQPPLRIFDDIRAQGFNGAEDSARRGGTEQGKRLANELTALHISNSRLQLIGHSNGGAVVGQAASVLSEGGQKIQRVTTLDAPNLHLFNILQSFRFPDLWKWEWTSVNAMRYVDPASALQVEVYYSDGDLGTGRLAFGFGAPLVSSATNVFNGCIFPGLPVLSEDQAFNSDHMRIMDWYQSVPSRLPVGDEVLAGIAWAIVGPGAGNFVSGNYTEQGYDSKAFGTTTVTSQKALGLLNLAVDGFEEGTTWLGQHAEIFMRDVGNAAVRLASGLGIEQNSSLTVSVSEACLDNYETTSVLGSDGYLYRDVSVPSDAFYLTFDLKVETPDVGDFLTVTLGNEIIYYKSLNIADSDFHTVAPIFVGSFAGQTATLLFTLNRVGDGTPSILLDNITFSAVSAAAPATDFTYTTDNGTVTITGYTGPGGDVTIPSTIEGLPVTGIAHRTFYRCTSLTSVTIPDSVTSIGDYAFEACWYLTNVTIGNGVTRIGHEAFWNCARLTILTIPDSVTTIGDWAYGSCGNLTNVTVGNGVSSIGDFAFGCCDSLTSMYFRGDAPGVGSDVFAYDDNATIYRLAGAPGWPTVPDAWAGRPTALWSGVFCIVTFNPEDGTVNPTSKTVTTDSAYGALPIPVRSGYTFGGWWTGDNGTGTLVTESTTVTATSDHTLYAKWTVLFPFSYTTDGVSVTITGYTGPGGDVEIPDYIAGLPVTSIGDYAFFIPNDFTPDTVTSVVIPDSVTTIGRCAFSGCSHLTNVVFGNGVTHIGDNAFSGCSSLQQLHLPGSVTTIGASAFQQCNSLTNVTIGSGVTAIGKDAFLFCTSLAAITVDTLNPTYSSLDGVLFNRDRTTLIECPTGKVGSYSVPDTVTGIADSAFSSTNLTTIEIPEGVTSIGDHAFSCSSLTSVMIPASVTSIGEAAFSQIYPMTEISVDTLSSAYSSRDGVLFNKVQTLLVAFPNGRTGSYTIPDGVTAIADAAFANSQLLTNVTIPDTVTSIGYGAFSYCDSLTSVRIPDSVTGIADWAFACRSLANVIIGRGVTTIGDFAFYGSALTKVRIPDSVTGLGRQSFGWCTGLMGIYFEGNAPSIPDGSPDVFYQADKVTVYYLAETTGWPSVPAVWAGRPTALWFGILDISPPSFAFTRAAPITYTVTYAGANAVALLPGNVTLNPTGTANGTVAVTGTSNTTRTVTISGITGNGTLGISIAGGTASGSTTGAALGAGPSQTFIVDNTPPTGTITINGGATYTTSTLATSSLTADDAGGSGISAMRFSNNGTTWSVWEPYAATKAWTLLTGAGLKTVRVQYQDIAGNTPLTFSDSITLVTSLSVTALSRTSQTGLTAAFSCTVSLPATEYAVMEGSWNAANAVWKPITGGTTTTSSRTFPCTFDLKPTVGTHTVYMAVRNPDLGLTSAARSLSVTLTGPAVYSLSTTKVSGVTATLAITVTGNPGEYAIMEGAWNTGNAVWTTIPAGTIVSGRLRFAADYTLLATAGAHTLYVAVRDPVTGLASATRSIIVTLAGPTMYSLSSAGVAGTTVTLRATARGGPDQYAAMESAWNAGAAVWQPITGATATSTSLTFTFPFVLTPEARAHTVYVAVRNSLLNAASAARSVTVTVATPTVTSITPASGPAGSALVTLTGTAFGPTAAGVAKVEFGGVSALIQTWSNTSVRCIVPATAPLGAVNVILTTSAGLPALSRVFTVLPFWYGNWSGTFQGTADTAIGAGALEHGWMNAATTALLDGSMSLRLGTSEILTGPVNASDGSFTLTGTGRDGSALTLAGTVTVDSLTGTLDWNGASSSGSRDLALSRPTAPVGTVSGTFVATVEDQFDSREGPPAIDAMLLAGSQSGSTVTLRDAVTAEVLTGPRLGDVFVAFNATKAIYGHITNVNASGQVTAFEATCDWADATSFGWGEIDAGRSDGTAGVSRGTTLWSFNPISVSASALLPATITVGYSNAITITVPGLGGVQHIAKGKIYHDPDGTGSTFVARETTLTLFGFWNGAVLDGGLEHQDPSIPFDSGAFTGTPR